MHNPVKTYTDAPPEYDGFGTTTVETNLGRTSRGIVRAVLTTLEHVQWQRCRYDSGLYLFADEAQFQTLSTGSYPLIQPM